MKNKSIPDSSFVKSSYSQPGGIINCVAVARTEKMVAVRDTKDPSKTTLSFTHSEWKAFLKGVRAGEFNV
ncbi:MAG: hypothetical protein A3C06_02425 [Candidatus Taylorbacteria bacterium RIFCSPHIGHO2_02_FULL_46_13]|uniref:DUF397 domain-containing protein n=1 Tax=Candidatus Taylorbacteria bacterium RIFCSPHIGHO2_02_FULL_46_13 TaxID=1802312 RepID=A0A1G2MRA7_9BACT|nr:MAG: hypothetical protein A3C06_02425 [Candidatus Taylorbacteria bacterium RIFCSPHIGHO2_02_FULL_46_13]